MTADNSYAGDSAVLRSGRDLGTEFVVGHQLASGALKPTDNTVATYFKTPWALASGGKLSAGRRLLDWVYDNTLSENGDFAGEAGRGTQQFNATYSNSWIIVGAQRLGDLRIAYRAMERLLDLQFSDGGFYRVTPAADVTGVQEDGIYTSGLVPATTDLLCTSMSGHACLGHGALTEATAAGNFLCEIWDSQPDVTAGIYFQWLEGSGLITKFNEESSRAFMIDASKTKQMYFQVGIATSFLAKLYEASGEQRFLEYAVKYMESTDVLSEDKFATPQSGKVGWGAAYLYRLTGNKKYRTIAKEVGNSLVALQGKSGSWYPDSGDLSKQLEVTSEFIALLTEIVTALDTPSN
jgi:hypothetical protein